MEQALGMGNEIIYRRQGIVQSGDEMSRSQSACKETITIQNQIDFLPLLRMGRGLSPESSAHARPGPNKMDVCGSRADGRRRRMRVSVIALPTLPSDGLYR